MNKNTFVPQIISVIREGYKPQQFKNDMIAAIHTAIVVLPLAIAFGIASGVSPQAGITATIIAAFISALLSGSRLQVSGPTGAFVVVTYTAIQRFGFNGLLIAALIAGILMIFMGIGRMGSLLKYIPYPVTLGFTSGIAVLIAGMQIKDFLGITVIKDPVTLVNKLSLYSTLLHTINPWAVLFGATSFTIVRLWHKVTHRIPGPIVALVLLTLIVTLFNIPITTIGQRYGELTATFPHFQPQSLNFSKFREIFPVAISIAILGSISSLLSAVVADGMAGEKHRPNMELIAQGSANVVNSLLGLIPSAGAVARTIVNVKNGGRTPFSALAHAVFLLLIMLALGHYASYIPIAVLCGILLSVALNMSEYHLFFKMFRAPVSDVSVLLVTFSLTILADLSVALSTGMILASFLFMKRMEEVTGANFLSSQDAQFHGDEIADLPQHIEVFEINGPFCFGAAAKFQDAVTQHNPDIIILHMQSVAIDATGLFALETVIDRAIHRGTKILLAGVKMQPMKALKKAKMTEKIGQDNFFPTLTSAIRKAKQL